MTRTTIMLPSPLKRRAERRAQTMGVSLEELIRRALETALRDQSAESGAMFDLPTFKGPKGVSSDVSKALYGGRRR